MHAQVLNQNNSQGPDKKPGEKISKNMLWSLGVSQTYNHTVLTHNTDIVVLGISLHPGSVVLSM